MSGPSVCVEILAEREEQDARFGEQNHPDFPDGADCAWAAWETESAKQQCAKDVLRRHINWRNILDEEVKEAFEQAALGNIDLLREELIQVAAVAVNWIEAIDRRTRKAPKTPTKCSCLGGCKSAQCDNL